MLTLAEFSELLSFTGQPVTWHQAKAPNQTRAVTAIVSSNLRGDEVVVNSYGINGRRIQVRATDLPLPPEKFDTITDSEGHVHIVDAVVAHQARGTGTTVSYTLMVKGK